MKNKDAIILQLRQENEELKKIVTELREGIIQLRKDNEQLRKENEELKEKLRLNSQNSSKPPSSDRYPPKKNQDNSNKERSKRPGFSRRWFPEEEISEIIQYFPEKCDKCGDSNFCTKTKVAEARQVVELPPIKPIITEHQAISCRCASCGKQVRAHLPLHVTSSVFGPKVKALSTLLAGKFHLSKRSIKKLFSMFFNIDISLGSIINVENQVAIFLKEPCEEALNILRKSDTAYADETGWRTKKETRWLWQVSDKNIVIFKIFASRGKKAFQALLGKECIQDLVTDRFRVIQHMVYTNTAGPI